MTVTGKCDTSDNVVSTVMLVQKKVDGASSDEGQANSVSGSRSVIVTTRTDATPPIP